MNEDDNDNDNTNLCLKFILNALLNYAPQFAFIFRLLQNDSLAFERAIASDISDFNDEIIISTGIIVFHKIKKIRGWQKNYASSL